MEDESRLVFFICLKTRNVMLLQFIKMQKGLKIHILMDLQKMLLAAAENIL